MNDNLDAKLLHCHALKCGQGALDTPSASLAVQIGPCANVVKVFLEVKLRSNTIAILCHLLHTLDVRSGFWALVSMPC